MYITLYITYIYVFCVQIEGKKWFATAIEWFQAHVYHRGEAMYWFPVN